MKIIRVQKKYADNFYSLCKNKKTMKTFTKIIPALAGIIAFVSCNDLCDCCDDAGIVGSSLSEVALMMSSLPIEQGQMEEVYSAVSSSSDNGYDEEYTMEKVFLSPGAGVGGTKAGTDYSRPLRELISEYYRRHPSSKAPGDAESRIAELTRSGCQIFWPYHENWDGESLPVITCDPGGESASNLGYQLVEDPDGTRRVEEVTVDEEMAKNRPVWVINTNDDSQYTSLEMLRRQDPSWGQGDDIIVRPSTKAGTSSGEEEELRTLILKDFTINRNYDSWFRGASEFFVKVGGVDGFTASTEEEMRNYQPSVTDFMIVVKRSDKGKPVPFNAILVSDWTDQMEEMAFLITEDDGGTQTRWKASAVVKVNSKSYGIEMDIPFNEKDDIVWRGSLSSKFIKKYAGQIQHYGDVDLTFDFL